MKLRVLTILLIVLATAMGARAQVVDTSFYKAQRGHYVSLEAGYGAMSLLHGMSGDDNTTDLRYGFQARFSYRWYIFRYWALGTGLHYQQMGTQSMVNSIQYIPKAVDEEGREIEHRTEFYNWEEKVDAHVFSVPAGIYLHGIQLMKRLKMNFGAGVMFNIPVRNSYKTTGVLETRLYYDQYHLELGRGVEGHHVDSIYRPYSGRYDLLPSLSVFGEMGFIYSLNRRIDITLTGLGAYGLSPTISGDKYLYDPDCMSKDAYSNTQYNGVLASKEAYGVRCLNMGGMLGIRYHIGTYSISPEELERARRSRNFDEIEFARNPHLEFDLLDKRKRREVEDSIFDIVENDRRRRDIEDPEVVQQRIRDSIAKVAADSIAKVAADSIAKAKADSIAKAKADSISIAVDTTHMDAVFNEVVRVELDSIVVSLNHNHCKFNDSRLQLTHSQKKSIDRLAYLMINFPSINIICIGHTCDIGTMEQNKAVGLKRAQAFAQELIDRGVSPDRIECQSKWFSEPLVPNTSEKNREINRRVEIKRK